MPAAAAMSSQCAASAGGSAPQETTATRFGAGVSAHGWAEIPALLRNADLLVNTSALGMTGQPALDISLEPLPDCAIISDIVYAPLKTDLLAAAEQRGLKAIDGLGMLLHQAVPGFERWFGVRPSVTEALRTHVLAGGETS